MVSAITNLQFELSTGNMYTDQPAIELVEAGEAPRNLIQLHALGRLLLQAADREPETKSASPQDDPEVIPLSAALLDRQYYTRGPTPYERLKIEDWNRDDYIGYGRWLDTLTQDPHKDRRDGITLVTQPLITQANRLGIGPSKGSISLKRNFGSLAGYYKALELVPKYKAYSEWTPQQLADHAERVFLELLEESGGHTGYVDFSRELNRRAKLGQGPSCEVFSSHGGWPMKFMALNGYADVRSMEPADYVAWGVRFAEANDGRLPSREAINLLAKTRRAPGADNFLSRFRWQTFLSEVREAREEQQLEAIKQRLPAILQEIDAGVLPRDIFQGTTAEGFIGVRAKWLLVDGLLPKLDRSHKRVIAQHVPVDKLKDVLRYTGHVDESDIDNAATEMGVKEDLWPTVKEPYLRVPEELLA